MVQPPQVVQAQRQGDSAWCDGQCNARGGARHDGALGVGEDHLLESAGGESAGSHIWQRHIQRTSLQQGTEKNVRHTCTVTSLDCRLHRGISVICVCYTLKTMLGRRQ